ncbi:unnamed protein product [Danaus chrysippus]|uniref:(African queen) hypothetical protein n=1 Tax=Danaus chrysippus TaxID=151541 RepID=A0A8J2QEE2_9NEOP|nr:unnamed protein product [Danaus chrysippus]
MILNLIKSPSRRTSSRERLMNICARIPRAGLARSVVIIILATSGGHAGTHSRTHRPTGNNPEQYHHRVPRGGGSENNGFGSHTCGGLFAFGNKERNDKRKAREVPPPRGRVARVAGCLGGGERGGGREEEGGEELVTRTMEK